ncbi:hypothetical protein [Mycolicibacterium gadium]|uniref:Uncharacterized protein n=1 Tax=Mycolicibacterium gadium TaxID=1794 RepID=A0ABT6GVF9_MYCGU|nr:hypothetical protein [Mycolicibacterium gadium]MDG5485299.1 hypothetical protein [Mycolicibacterium gadium]
MAVDTADSVSAAGGLIFDSIRAGWIVDIYLESLNDERALYILGARSVVLPEVFEFEHEWPDAVFLSAAVHDRHRGVQRLVAGCIRRQISDIGVWGGSVPGLDAEAVGEHRLSTAARAFKPHALNAAGLPPQVTNVESFSGGRRR